MSPYRAASYLNLYYYRWEILSSVYDRDWQLQTAIATLMPDFEYPDWSHRTVGELCNHLEKQ